MRKSLFAILITFLVVFALGASSLNVPAYAQGPKGDFTVSVDVTGVIQSITVSVLTFTDATTFKINQDTKGVSPDLKPGVTVTVTAGVDEADDSNMVALSITVGTSANDNPSQSSDVTATPETSANSAATPTATPPGKGKGKGNGNDDNGGNKGNGKGQDKGDKGKGKDQKVAECLKNTTQPVATILAKAFNVPYSEIMTWHCNGRGFGEIARAYLLASKTNMTVAQIFALRDAHKGWGQIIKDAGLNPKDFAPGSIIKAGKAPKGGKDNKDKSDDND